VEINGVLYSGVVGYERLVFSLTEHFNKIATNFHERFSLETQPITEVQYRAMAKKVLHVRTDNGLKLFLAMQGNYNIKEK